LASRLRVLLLLAKAKLLAPIKPDFPKRADVNLDELDAPVTVYRDGWGVPHIYAENEQDLYFVFGYLQAQDRLFLMDFQRRAAEGKLAEVVGERAYESDTFYRTIGLERAVKATKEALEERGGQRISGIMGRFVDGINRAIGDMIGSGGLPLEFKILEYEPEPWSIIDSLAVSKFMGWLLTGNLHELGYFKVRESLGDFTEVLFPFDRPYETSTASVYDAPIDPVRPRETGKKSAVKQGGGGGPVAGNLNINLAWEKGKADRPPAFDPFLASNNWVVAGSLTETGKPILCNDPHLPLMAPPVWYEAHLVCRDSGGTSLNVRGVTFPGVPFILTGRNRRISWGVTNVGADVIDFYRYDWSEDGTEYRYLDRWEKTTTITEKIKVKVGDSAEEREHGVILTRHGPVMERDGERFAVRWLGHYPTMETLAFYGINTAKDIEEFKEALRYFHFPAQNFVYADVDGNIAWWASGRYPIRSNISEDDDYIEYRIPFNGSDGRGEWGDWDDPNAWVDPPDEVPHIVNPEAGYIATANNCPASRREFPHWLGWTWAESHRINRIVGMLIGTRPLDVEDMSRIQTDIYSIPAEKLVPHIVKACEEGRLDDGVRGAVDALKEWDFEMDEDGVAPTIFATWLDKFRKNAFPDILESAGLGNTPTTETIQRLFEQGSNEWLEFIGSGKRDIRDLIVGSLRDAVEQLRKDHGQSMSGWRWGSINHLNIEHPLGSAISWFNYPRLPAGGWYNCVNPGGGRLMRFGTSWRQIIDLGDQRNSLCVLPGGQLGHPFSRHYRDQLGFWLEGRYKPMTMPESPEELEGIASTIRFNPKAQSP